MFVFIIGMKGLIFCFKYLHFNYWNERLNMLGHLENVEGSSHLGKKVQTTTENAK